jgi:hypothetical protein
MSIANLTIAGASITLLVLFCAALRGSDQTGRSARNSQVVVRKSQPAKIPDAWVVKILSRCHVCMVHELLISGEHRCEDCGRMACHEHATPCVVCARVTCLTCSDTWSGLDGMACCVCQGRVS